MQKIAAYTLVSLFALALIIAVIAWLALVWKLVQIPFNLKSGVSLSDSGANPFNVIFDDDKLTQRGFTIRNQAGFALMIFTGASAVSAAFGLLAYWLASA